MASKVTGPPVAEGKTKILIPTLTNPDVVIVRSKDDITAGDGAKHDVIPGKAALATTTTCNNFRLLGRCGIPVAFIEQESDVSFTAPLCKMLPFEVVARREAHGSFLKRSPNLGKGHVFPKLLVEFFLKTKDKKWGVHDLACDDPYMVIVPGRGVLLYDPKLPYYPDAKPFLVLPFDEVPYSQNVELLEKMDKVTRQVFFVLEKAWQLQGMRLVDFKIEFGLNRWDSLLVADVIDNDSWRVLDNGAYIDKQVYRDGGGLSEVAEKYRMVADLTSRFQVPKQRIVVWAGSNKDVLTTLTDELDILEKEAGIEHVQIIRSAHKQPVQAYQDLQIAVQQVPNIVVIAVIGMSNGAGPMLSAITTSPVITVPANAKEFPEDVWSSLRAPSNVPVMTVLSQANAVHAAANILAQNNPRLYMVMRNRLEDRLVNVVTI